MIEPNFQNDGHILAKDAKALERVAEHPLEFDTSDVGAPFRQLFPISSNDSFFFKKL